MKRMIIFCGLSLCASTAALADSRLNRDEIISALSGYSMIWRSDQEVSTQYFDPRGITFYERVGKKPESGVWTVSEDHLFCSRWGRGGWSCYQVVRAPETMIFTGPVNQPVGLNNVMVGRLVSGNRTSAKSPEAARQPPAVMQALGRIMSGDYLGGLSYQ
jgi:hypothetical protein